MPFVFLENAHLQAIARTSAGVESTVTLTNHTGAGDVNGGTVRTAVAVLASSTLTIFRNVPATQTTSYQEGGDFPAASHERALDKLTFITQQNARGVTNAIKIPTSENTNTVLPSAVNRANRAMGFAANGDVSVSGSTLTQIDGAVSAINTIASAPAGNSAGIAHIANGSGATATTVQAKLRETVSVKDFGAVGDGVADDTAAIQAAIDFVAADGGGGLMFGSQTYKISAPLIIGGKVNLVGSGAGRVFQPIQAAATTLAWYGSAEEMVKFGWQSSTATGGGIANMRLDGRAIATKCIAVKDVAHATFADCVLVGATHSALYVFNTPSYDPTGFCLFDRLQISLRGGSTNAAHGIYLDGTGSGADGVTLNTFNRPRIEHANGDGLRLGLRADGNTFLDFFAFRASTVETGYGINFTSNSVSAVNTTNKFLGSTVSVGGIFMPTPASTTSFIGTEGTKFESVNVTELALDLSNRFTPFVSVGKVYGNGQTDKRLRTGFSRLMQENQSHSFDDFRFVAYSHPVLTTNGGSWFAVRNGAGGSIISATQPGGAVDLIAGDGGTDDIAIYSSADFTSGITFANNPIMMFCAAPATGVADALNQWGMFGDATMPNPSNGIYVQFDVSVNANYQLISRKNGSSTVTSTNIAGASAKRYWLICLDDTQNAAFFTRLATETQWTYLATNGSNVPLVNLLAGFRCRSQVANFRDAHIYSCEFGHSHE